MEHPTYLDSMHEYTITDKGVMDEYSIEEYFEKIMEDKKQNGIVRK